MGGFAVRLNNTVAEEWGGGLSPPFFETGAQPPPYLHQNCASSPHCVWMNVKMHLHDASDVYDT